MLAPGRHPWAKAAGVGVLLSLATVVVGLALYAADAMPPRRDGAVDWPLHAFFGLLVSPLVETLVLAGLVEALRRLRVPLPVACLAVAGLAVLAHPDRGVGAATVVLGFGVMAWQYGAYRDALGVLGGIGGVWITHATYNAVLLGTAAALALALR